MRENKKTPDYKEYPAFNKLGYTEEPDMEKILQDLKMYQEWINVRSARRFMGDDKFIHIPYESDK